MKVPEGSGVQCRFPEQAKVPEGSDACLCRFRRRQVPEAGSGGRFRRQVLEGSGPVCAGVGSGPRVQKVPKAPVWFVALQP